MKHKKDRKRSDPTGQFRRKQLNILAMGIGVAGVTVVVWWAVESLLGDDTLEVTVPELSLVASAGKTAFDANCAQCHGQNAAGTENGPPLIHDIYNPGHHSDASFYSAAKRGVRQHHWPFGNMPAQPQLRDDEIAAIIRYVRELQLANGITYKPHNM
jgi:mono/diheme cytochrome c family protein